MAKNYSVVEALEILKGDDVEAKIDVIKRYPLFSVATPEQIVKALPEEITAKKVEGMLRGNVEVDKFGEEEVVPDDTKVKNNAEKAVKEVIEDKPKRGRRKKAEVVEEIKNAEDDFDWDDDEKVEEKPKKLKSKKVVEEDDDDWDDDVPEEKQSESEDENEPWDDEEIESEVKNENTDDEEDDEWDF